jgi:hypothetical protein
MISAELLRRIRNDLPMAVTIAALGRGGPPSKFREGRFVFLCPHGGELLAAVNPRNNLAHCFACQINLNNIDLLRHLGHDFLSAVALLVERDRCSQARGVVGRTGRLHVGEADGRLRMAADLDGVQAALRDSAAKQAMPITFGPPTRSHARNANPSTPNSTDEALGRGSHPATKCISAPSVNIHFYFIRRRPRIS